jgi:Cd2+/Zn2+-exporting ATPase
MQETLVGNAKLLKNNGINIVEFNKPGTVLYVAIGSEFAGYIVIEDQIKPDAEKAIKNLNELSIEDVSICTGDEEAVAKMVCAKVGLKNYYSGLLPEDKVMVITDKVQEGKTVAFVGDGINDAPSLANSNVGIAMGGLGSDIAVEAADVVIMNDEPSKVAVAIKKARKTHKIVLENIICSIGLKVIILALIGFGLAGMWLAVFADVGVNLLAVLNSLRALLK